MKQISKNILTTTSLNIFTYLIPLLVTPYFIRIAGTENFGELSIAQTVIQYLFLFVGFNLDTAVAGDIAIVKNEKDKLNILYWKTIISRLLLLGIATAIFILLCIILHFQKINLSLFIITFLGLLGYAITPLWFYQGTENFGKLFLFVVIGKILFALVIFSCVKKTSDFWYYALALSLSQIISGLFLFFYPIYSCKLTPIKITLHEAKRFLIEKLPLFTGGTMVNFCMNINVTLLGILLPLKDFGLYMAANKLVLVFFSLTTLPLNQSFYPYLSRSISENIDTTLRKVQSIMVPGLFYITLGFSLIIFLFAKQIILLMMGAGFVTAYWPFRVMSFSLIANVITYVIALQIFIRLSNLKIYAKITQISASASILFTISLSFFFGINGAALAWTCNEFLLLILCLLYLRKIGIQIVNIRALHPRNLSVLYNNYRFLIVRK